MLQKLSIREAHEKLRWREFSASELAAEYLKTIEENDTDLKAYLEVYDDVTEQAKKADARFEAGTATLLTGIPLALKDNLLRKGFRVSAASRILEGYRAVYDATVVTRLKDAGAVFLGRTNMDEFAMGSSTENSAFQVTTNPHDPTRVPGGSSGGSAAAVAGGEALVSLGSDTGGSVREPASFCGVVGLKPTYGSVSRSGLIALGSSLDVVGPLGRSVADVEAVFEVISGRDPLDATTLPDSYHNVPLRERKVIGVPYDFLEKGIDADVLSVFYKNLDHFKELGFRIKSVSLPNVKLSLPAYYIIMPAEASTNLARFDGVKYGLHIDGDTLLDDYRKTRGGGFGREPRRRILIGTYVLSAGYLDAYYNKAKSARAVIRDEFDRAFSIEDGGVDVIVSPTSPTPAPKIGEKNDPLSMYLLDIFTVPANLTGMPAISLPAGFVVRDGVKLPVGLQLMGPHLSEKTLFTIGKTFLGEE